MKIIQCIKMRDVPKVGQWTKHSIILNVPIRENREFKSIINLHILRTRNSRAK